MEKHILWSVMAVVVLFGRPWHAQGEETMERGSAFRNLAALEAAVAEKKNPGVLESLSSALLASAREAGTPLTRGNAAAFIYFGKAGTVSADGAWDLEDGDGSITLRRLDPLDVWVGRVDGIPSEAEFLYRFSVDGKVVGDPLCKENHNGFGPNSLGRMPCNSASPEMEVNSKIPHGVLETFKVESKVAKNTRQVSVYLPPQYAKEKKKRFPVLYIQDGEPSIGAGHFDRVADNLLSRKAIQPVILCFISPVNRVAEYWFEEKVYEQFMVEEMVPMIDARYRTLAEPEHRGISGTSLGGRISTFIASRHPGLFGICIGQSSYFEKDSRIIQHLQDQPRLPIRFHYDVGIYERGIGRNFGGDFTRDLLVVNRDLRDLLRSKGNEVTYREWSAGHCMLTWGRGMAAALQLIWPGPNAAPAP